MKKILFVLILIILAYILLPKSSGLIWKVKLPFSETVRTMGKRNQCLGVTLFEEKGEVTPYRCIGIPFGEIRF